VSTADAAIYIGGWVHGYSDAWDDNAYDAEVLDKPSMILPFGQEALIQAVLQANPNTIIVLVGGGPVDMRKWKNKTKGIVQAWYAGMEGGNALANILFGEVNPSGKLPMTFPEKLEDSPAHSLAQYPDENLLIDHKDDIYVGYRYFDTYDIEPAFAFGHGLSYTTFDYTNLNIEKNGERVKMSLLLSNIGQMAGAEVVQVYVQDEKSSLERPEKELKAFHKTFLTPGASEEIIFELNKDAFSYFDDNQQKWVLEPGKFNILVGSSSRDIRLSGDIEME
jgi:beta-glucosidase